MTHDRHPSARTICMVATALLGMTLLPIGPASAQATKDEQKVTLRAIMQQLGAEYGRLASSLLIDDFKGLGESAKAIRGHPLPNGIVIAIKDKLGRNFRSFEQADEETHQQADALAKRAAAKDITGAARAFNGMTDGCVRCHKEFRATLRSLSD